VLNVLFHIFFCQAYLKECVYEPIEIFWWNVFVLAHPKQVNVVYVCERGTSLLESPSLASYFQELTMMVAQYSCISCSEGEALCQVLYP
jgi:hypothetical protein